MIKTISGSWFEFQHHNMLEGKYWNPICRHFSAEQWRAKVREMKSLGMKYIVLLCSSLVTEEFEEAYFKTKIYPPALDFGCENAIEILMDEAEKCEMKVFMSVGYYGIWTHTRDNMIDPAVTKRAFRAMEELYALYGKFKSFYGWYLPDESCIRKYFDEDFMRYVNLYSDFGKSFDPQLRVMIAPYGTNRLSADDVYISQLERLHADFIAYQDEVGVKKSQPDETAPYYEALKIAHDKAGRAKLWADVELFTFEGTVYTSALLPAAIDRIETQLRQVSPYVDEVLAYQYLGIMNQPGTIAYCGHPDSIALYNAYKSLKERLDQKNSR